MCLNIIRAKDWIRKLECYRIQRTFLNQDDAKEIEQERMMRHLMACRSCAEEARKFTQFMEHLRMIQPVYIAMKYQGKTPSLHEASSLRERLFLLFHSKIAWVRLGMVIGTTFVIGFLVSLHPVHKAHKPMIATYPMTLNRSAPAPPRSPYLPPSIESLTSLTIRVHREANSISARPNALSIPYIPTLKTFSVPRFKEVPYVN